MKFRNAGVLVGCLFWLGGSAIAAPSDDTQPDSFLHKFSIKFMAGMTFLQGGDMKEWFDAESDYYRWLGSQTGYSARHDYSLSRVTFFPALEVVGKITPRFGISLSTGYFEKSWGPSSAVTYDYGEFLGTDLLQRTLKIEAGIVPITITGLYALSIHRKTQLDIMAGLGYYVIHFHFLDETVHSWPDAPGKPNYQYRLTSRFEPRNGVFGIHAGIGAQRAVFTGVSLTLEILYRTARVREMRGDVERNEILSWTGHQESNSEKLSDQTLWYGRSQLPGSGYARAVIDGTKPDWLDGVRAFEFGLDGLVLRAGIKIKL